jgi:AAA domain-containing protein
MDTNTELPLANSMDSAAPPELTPQKLLSIGVLWGSEVDRICANEIRTQFLVDGFLPAKSVAIAAGDSTIGKSPLVLQLALCVAAGVAFLGMRTTKGRVLYFDLENPLPDFKVMRDSLVRFLGLSDTPKDFLLVTEPQSNLERLIAEIRPQLIVIDSVRSFRPDVTETNTKAGEWLKQIRSLARKYGCAFLLVHHLKKPARGREGDLVELSLQSLPVAKWMLEMEGPRAFVNQTDVRLGVARSDSNRAALEVKWSRRIYGDSPLVLLDRVFDADGEPAGYRHLSGAALLTQERREALEKLLPEFSFKEAKAALDRSDDPTMKFLRECVQLGVVEKIARGRYRKMMPAAAREGTGELVVQ